MATSPLTPALSQGQREQHSPSGTSPSLWEGLGEGSRERGFQSANVLPFSYALALVSAPLVLTNGRDLHNIRPSAARFEPCRKQHGARVMPISRP